MKPSIYEVVQLKTIPVEVPQTFATFHGANALREEAIEYLSLQTS